MGREIVYCEGCGKRLTEDDFDRGKAQDHDNRPFCSTCRPISSPAPEPPPPAPGPGDKRATERRGGTSPHVRRRGATERIPMAQAPNPGSIRRNASAPNVALYVGVGLAALVLIVVAVASTGHREPILPPPEPPPPQIARPTAVEIADERLRELEAFATPSADPQAILSRCDQLRAAFRGLPQEARFKQIEARAQERLKEKEQAADLDRSLESIRRIIADDPDYKRRAEVEGLLDAAVKRAGARLAEVQRLKSDYRILCEDDAKRKAEAAAKKKEPPPPPPPPPAAPKWAELFVKATQQVQANNYPGAKAIYLEGLAAAFPERRPEDMAQRAVYCIGLYNLACIYSVEVPKLAEKARAQAMDDAFKYLDWSLRSDYGRFRCPCHPQTLGLGHMGDDKDMDPIRKDPRYAELLNKYK